MEQHPPGAIVRPDRLWFVFGCILAVSLQCYGLFAERTAGSRVARLLVLREFAAGKPVSQTFRAGSDGLAGVTVWLRGEKGLTADTEIRCELSRLDGSRAVPVHRWIERVRVEDGRASTLRFPLVEDSAGLIFRLDLLCLQPGAAAPALEASLDDVTRPGVLYVDGREQWGDLRFETRAVSRYRAYLTQAHGLPGLVRRPIVHLSALALYDCLVAGFVYCVIGSGRRETEPRHRYEHGRSV